MRYKALTIAGSDSGGGAGIQADLKTFAALGVYGASAITAVTAQNTQGVLAIHEMSRQILRAQLDAVFSDIDVNAVKIGMLFNEELIDETAATLRKYAAQHIVLDTVMVSTSGTHLLLPEAIDAFKQKMLPLAEVVTPNLPEAELLIGRRVYDAPSMLEAAKALHALGARNVVVKGGHLKGAPLDLLYDGAKSYEFFAERLPDANTHGTGCTFSSAVAAGLAKKMPVHAAVEMAKSYTNLAIQHGFSIGQGRGPLHHLYSLYKKAGGPDETLE